MRTTVTIEPDVEALLRKVMRERDLSFKEALNSALRVGLQSSEKKSPRKFQQKTYSMGFKPEIALDKTLALSTALEDEEILRKLSLRK